MQSLFLKRARPLCADLPWAEGTGLIWREGETLFYENPRNRFMRFRKTFGVSSAVVRAELRLFADTHYIAWLNGRFIGRGPWRSDPTWTYFDTLDVTPFLKPGVNVLAVLCLFQGFGTGSRISIMQGLLAHLEMERADGSVSRVVSDASWKTSPAHEFLRPTPRLHGPLGCVEVQDLRLSEPGWREAGFDDAAWASSAYVKPDLNVAPWYYFVPNELPARAEGSREALPALKAGHVAAAPPPVETMGCFRAAPPMEEGYSFPLALEGAGEARVVNADFGEILAGLLRLEVEGPAGAVVDILFAEDLMNGCVPQPPQARVLCSRFILREGRQTLEAAFNYLAFRYVQVWVWSQGSFALHSARVNTLAYPLPAVKGFECSDAFLNQLDAACERTIRLCAQDGIVDSASREQQQWIGDARETAIMMHHRFPAGGLHRRLIEQIGQGMDWMGSLVPRYPSGNRNVSPIPLYNLQWLRAFEDYWWYTGDLALIEAWWPNLVQGLRWFSAFVSPAGLLERVPHWMYLDLGEGPSGGRAPGSGAVNTSLNLVYLDVLRCVGRLGTLIGDASLQPELDQRSESLRNAIRGQLWNEAAGAYVDASTPGRAAQPVYSEGTAAHALLHLEPPGSPRALRLLQAIRENTRLVKASPFAMNFVLRALDRHGEIGLGLDLIRERYRNFVKTGTTWENWESHYRGGDGIPMAHSFSHAWSATPLAFFVHSICGIRPKEPGWKSVEIVPGLCDLTGASTSVATQRGTISVRYERASGGLKGAVELPEGVTGRFRLPDGRTGPLGPGRNVL